MLFRYALILHIVKTNNINPFQTNVSFLYPMKTSENTGIIPDTVFSVNLGIPST